MAKVTMPQLGESVAEGTIGKWLKQPGDEVAKYEPLLEVITDKVNAEVPSPFAGVLSEILAEEGATVPNNAEIAVIETAEEAGGDAPAAATPDASATDAPAAKTDAPAAPADAPAATAEAPAATAEAAAPADGPAGSDERPAPAAAAAPAAPAATPAAPAATAPPPAAAAPAAAGDSDARMTPAVRRLLREHALGPEQIVGTGGGGRITRDDVLAVVETIRTGGSAPAPAATPTPAAAAASAAASEHPPRPRRLRPRPPRRPLPRAVARSPSPTAPTRCCCR